MSGYRKEWPCCGDETYTEAWEPERCPFCELNDAQDRIAELETELEAARAQQSGEGRKSSIEVLRCQQCGNLEPFHATGCATEFGAYTSPPKAQGVPEGWREAVQRAVDELSIMDESEGIAGFHLNGDVSPWGEGELPAVRDELQALLSNIPQPAKPEGEWVKCSERLPSEYGRTVIAEDSAGRVVPVTMHHNGEGRYFTELNSNNEVRAVRWQHLPTGLTRPAAPDMGGAHE